jgi:hypothetical protein
VKGNGTAGGPYSLAKLFDGTSKCDTSNAAFGGFGGPVVNVSLLLREPLSGTMNTTEYSLFRTTANPDSQETGISSAAGGGDSPVNPVYSGVTTTLGACTGGGGSRYRAIGTGQVASGIQGNANYLGYLFFSFANASSVFGTNPIAQYNYMVLDGVDPFGDTTNTGLSNAAQTLPNCIGPCTQQGPVSLSGTVNTNGTDVMQVSGGTFTNLSPGDIITINGVQYTIASVNSATDLTLTASAGVQAGVAYSVAEVGWGGLSFPTLRKGTYGAWSLYRWVTASDLANETDTLGPAHLAQFAQNAVDGTDADFVPFKACSSADPTCSTTAPVDGLAVYHSHFSYTFPLNTCTASQPGCVPDVGDNDIAGNNGAATPANTKDGGNALGGNNSTVFESGGDMGGVIEGMAAFNATTHPDIRFPFRGVADVTNASAAVSKDSGSSFVTGTSWNNNSIILGGTTVNGVPCTGGTTYTISSVTSTTALTLTTPYAGTTNDAINFCVPVAPPGVLNKRR